MAINTRSILGQSDLAATTETEVYTAPTAELGASISTITLCNRTGSGITVRLGFSPGGGTPLLDAEWVVYGKSVGANDTLTLGPFSIGPDDSVVAWAAAVDLSVNVFGIEHA